MGPYWLIAYRAYLIALEELQNRSGSEEIPTTLIWHHDDMLLNFTTINHFLRDEKKYFGAMPNNCDETVDFPEWQSGLFKYWTLSTEKMVQEYLKSDDWEPSNCPWLGGVRPLLQQLLNEGGFLVNLIS